jgi:hypothetical protein
LSWGGGAHDSKVWYGEGVAHLFYFCLFPVYQPELGLMKIIEFLALFGHWRRWELSISFADLRSEWLSRQHHQDQARPRPELIGQYRHMAAAFIGGLPGAGATMRTVTTSTRRH